MDMCNNNVGVGLIIINRLLIGMITLLTSNVATPYEINSHAVMTRAAFYQSALFSDESLAIDYNWFLGADAFGDSYYDMKFSDIGPVAYIPRARSAHQYEERIINRLGENPLSIVGWMMRGSIREDDIPSFGDEPPNDLPLGDSPFFRVFNHFYDPNGT